jgi:predicted Zn-dependent peptidase
MLWQAYLIHDPNVDESRITGIVDEVIGGLRSEPVDAATLERAKIKWRSSFYDYLGSLYGFGRADVLASLALFDDNPQRINEFEREILAVTPEQILATAKEYLRPTNRTIYVLEAGGAPAGQEEAGDE